MRPKLRRKGLQPSARSDPDCHPRLGTLPCLILLMGGACRFGGRNPMRKFALFGAMVLASVVSLGRRPGFCGRIRPFRDRSTSGRYARRDVRPFVRLRRPLRTGACRSLLRARAALLWIVPRPRSDESKPPGSGSRSAGAARPCDAASTAKSCAPPASTRTGWASRARATAGVTGNCVAKPRESVGCAKLALAKVGAPR